MTMDKQTAVDTGSRFFVALAALAWAIERRYVRGRNVIG